MSEISDLEQFMFALADTPGQDRLPFLKGWLLREPDIARRKHLETLFLAHLNTGTNPKVEKVVILVHGIRTQATWQGMVTNELSAVPNVVVMSVGYGYFDVLKFWAPYLWRNMACKEVLRKVRDIQANHQNHELVVIAHSFGTYIVSQILRNEPDVRIGRVLMCGCIIRRSFRWDSLPGDRRAQQMVNDVGTRDVWPVLAKIGSWGYGESGTFGFKDPSRVTDRFHNLGHSDFFSVEHVRSYWAPFVKTGEITPSSLDKQRPTPSFLLSVACAIPIKLILTFVVVVIAYLYWR